MVKRVLLALTFVAALGVAGLGFSSTAEAGHGCGRGGGRGGFYGAYYGPAPYYGPVVRRSYYYGPPAYYGPGPGYISYGRYGRHSAFSFSLGF